MWRKNRSRRSFLPFSCVGVDLNRNFGYKYALKNYYSKSTIYLYSMFQLNVRVRISNMRFELNCLDGLVQKPTFDLREIPAMKHT